MPRLEDGALPLYLLSSLLTRRVCRFAILSLEGVET
jgi:hypothetical protein